ncbi:MAG: hypothetical protein U0359_22460 [Byssovorax sp.]
MPLKDPPRLLDQAEGTPAALRRALSAARADHPSAADLARLAQRLPLGGSPPPGGSTATPAAPLAAVPSAVPGAIVGALLGLATIGVYALLAPGDPPPGASLRPPPAIEATSRAIDHRSAAAREAAPSPGETASRPIEAPSRPPAEHPERAARSADPVAGSSAPLVAPPAGSAADRAPSSAPEAIGAGAALVEGEDEVTLLQHAQDALGASPARALDLLGQHAARFPGAALGQEREVMSIDALVRLGRTGEARTRAAAFAARFPTSAHLGRIEALLGEKIDRGSHNDQRSPAPTP